MKLRYVGAVIVLAASPLFASCAGGGSAKPADTSTPPAVTEPSAPVPEPDTTPTTPQVVNAGIGETFTITYTNFDTPGEESTATADVTVNSMKDVGAVIPDPDGFHELDYKAEHGRFVVFTVTYASTAGAFPYNMFDWTVRMPDGQEYSQGIPDTTSLKLGQDLSSGTIHKGVRAKGLVSFDIPQMHGTLVYMAGSSGEVNVKF